jgi:uncharacterized membrane protein
VDSCCQVALYELCFIRLGDGRQLANVIAVVGTGLAVVAGAALAGPILAAPATILTGRLTATHSCTDARVRDAPCSTCTLVALGEMDF